MSKKLPRIVTGCDDFGIVATQSDIFVDKSLIVQEVVDSTQTAILLTKPRRWGKSLALDLLAKFFSLETDKDGNALETNSNRVLFEGGQINLPITGVKQLQKLKIAEIDSGYYMKYQGRYPVIHFTLKGAVGSSIEELTEKLKYIIRKNFEKFSYLHNSPKLSEAQKKEYSLYTEGEPTQAQLEVSLKLLTELLHTHHGIRAYIIIDEYDKPVNNLLEDQEQDIDTTLLKDVAILLTRLFSECGKSNPHLEKMILSGIFDTLKREGNSGLNNLQVFTLDSPQYSRHFGFSEEEVNMLMSAFDFEDKDKVQETIRDWYNGYNVPTNNNKKLQVYSPWAVVNYINKAASQQNFAGEAYWVKSGSATVFQNMLKEGRISHEFLIKFKKLIDGEEVEIAFNNNRSLFEYNLDIDHGKYSDHLASHLLYYSGYLTMQQRDSKYWFRIPNFELKQEFLDTLSDGIETLAYNITETESVDVRKLSIKHLERLCELSNRSLLQEKILEAYNAITHDDTLTLAKIIKLIPECGNEYFNLFHLVAIAGNKASAEVILQSCKVSLLNKADNIYKLTPLDYANLLQHTEIQQLFMDNQAVTSRHNNPTLTESFACYLALKDFTFILTGATGALIFEYSYSKIVPVRTTFSKIAVGVYGFAISSYIASLVPLPLKEHEYCSNYKEYSKKTVTPLDTMQTYINTHPNAYVTTSKCNAKDKSVIKESISLTPYEEDKHYISLTLCDNSASEQSPNHLWNILTGVQNLLYSNDEL